MGLTFVYGNSGSGKSEFVYRRVAGLAALNPYQRYYVVVPEQFTLYTQKKLVEVSGRGVILNIDVVSFERLASRVFDELGIRGTVMEETGKTLLLRRIAQEHREELECLGTSLARIDFVEEIKSVISELMQYGITPADLEKLLDGMSETEALFYKLHDILILYRAFDLFLKKDVVTAEKVPELLMEAAPDSALLRGAVFVFDGFTGFTPVQMRLLGRLMTLCKDMVVTVTLDFQTNLYAPADLQDLFYMSHKMVNALRKLAVECQFPVEQPVCIRPDHGRFSGNPVLGHLERNLFRPNAQVFEDPCGESLRIVCAKNPRAELEFAAQEVCRLVRCEGWRYRDFAVVTGSAQLYLSYAQDVFGKCGIPFFADLKQEIQMHPAVELIRAAMEMAVTDYSQGSVFRYLRTGLTGFTNEETDLLENYCLEFGIRGVSRFKKPFLKPFGKHGRLPENPERSQEELDRVNGLRQRFWEQTNTFCREFRKKESTVRSRTEALYRLCCSLELEDRLRASADAFDAAGESRTAGIYRQMYKIMIDLFDKLVALLGDENMGSDEYAQILDAGFAAARVGSVPQGRDCLILGDIERTRLDGVKVLFFVGMSDAQIPKKGERGSLLSEYDRGQIEARGMELAPAEREQVFLERFYLYLGLTKPSRKLYLTYAGTDEQGKTARPSYLIGMVSGLFPGTAEAGVRRESGFTAERPEAGIEAYLAGLQLAGKGKVTGEWKALHNWYRQDSLRAGRVSSLFQARFGEISHEKLCAALTRMLYGEKLTGSVTRMEQYAKCPFAHFLEYGLKLEERKTFAFESPQMGQMFHTILMNYSTRVEQNADWDSVTPGQQEEFLQAALEEALLAMPNEALLDSARSSYMLERIRRIMRTGTWVVTEQIRKGDFRPEEFEVPFSRSFGRDMELIGRIDRLDTFEKDGKIYIRVVDYKSGKTEFRLLDFYNGRQLQLAVYLGAALEKTARENPGTEVVPAALFYTAMDDPAADADKLAAEGNKRLAKAQKLEEETDRSVTDTDKRSAEADQPGAANVQMETTGTGQALAKTGETAPKAVPDWAGKTAEDAGREVGAHGQKISETEQAYRQFLLQELRPVGLISTDPDAWGHMDRGLRPSESSDVIPMTLNKDGSVRGSSSAVTAGKLSALADFADRKAEEICEGIRAGNIQAEPFRSKGETGCKYCPYSSVCGFDIRLPGYGYREEEEWKNSEIWDRILAGKKGGV